jgi:hypothetical protein
MTQRGRLHETERLLVEPSAGSHIVGPALRWNAEGAMLAIEE